MRSAIFKDSAMIQNGKYDFYNNRIFFMKNFFILLNFRALPLLSHVKCSEKSKGSKDVKVGKNKVRKV